MHNLANSAHQEPRDSYVIRLALALAFARAFAPLGVGSTSQPCDLFLRRRPESPPAIPALAHAQHGLAQQPEEGGNVWQPWDMGQRTRYGRPAGRTPYSGVVFLSRDASLPSPLSPLPLSPPPSPLASRPGAILELAFCSGHSGRYTPLNPLPSLFFTWPVHGSSNNPSAPEERSFPVQTRTSSKAEFNFVDRCPKPHLRSLFHDQTRSPSTTYSRTSNSRLYDLSLIWHLSLVAGATLESMATVSTSTMTNTNPPFNLVDEAIPQPSSSPAALPNFVFPARAPPSSAPASSSRGTSRRPMSAFELTASRARNDGLGGDKRAELPAFSFKPSGLASPPASPDKATFPKSSGHRRGQSEFIGGDGLKVEGTKTTTPRRGHAHRRSAAISMHDLTTITLKPNNPTPVPRGSSAPNSPSYEHEQPSPPFQFPNADEGPIDLSKAPNRSRVLFSDQIEVIPRPLSIISSDSSSTVTARKSHSLNGSLSSIVSGGTSSPSTKDRGLQSPGSRALDSRPRTAGSILDAAREPFRVTDDASPGRRCATPVDTDLAVSPITPSTPSTPKFASKKWAFFGHESMLPEASPTRSRPASATSSEKEQQVTPAAFMSAFVPLSDNTNNIDKPAPSIEQQPVARKSSVSRKPSKKQKKVKSWAGSILSRKSRPRKGLSRRSPTPPRSFSMMDEATRFDPSEAMLSTSAPESSSSSIPPMQTDFASWKPRHVTSQDDEIMSPIIDLDAALGPFNTPSGYDAEWESSQRSSNPKRRMHSAAGMKGFVGPGMHYHRRAESAPEFENPRFGLHRLGSSSTMADVFEEDEEDDEWEDSKAASDKESSNKCDEDEDTGLGIDIKVVDADNMQVDNSMDWSVDSNSVRGIKRKGSGLSDVERQYISSSTSLKDEPILEESSPVEIVDDSDLSRPDSRSESTPTPPLRAHLKNLSVDTQQHPVFLMPSYPTPTSARSSLPSPRSPFSYDTQLISTAPSSEYSFQSLLLGSPGPELRMSMSDDVDVPPSLSSSASTMTRESVVPRNAQFRDGQRSSSLSSVAINKKRTSIASLSRLINSSHGSEKSKLSVEQRPSTSVSEIEGKPDKAKKSKRISRLMNFWRAKE
ncbi:hypothetical protein B7494_g3328 [Chlorociboria aeruginascens]|nr:hypothetical protein B7494_g3328 [Chlorociboria aeruginascens]